MEVFSFKGSYFRVGLTHLLFLLKSSPLRAEHYLLPLPCGPHLPLVRHLPLWTLRVGGGGREALPPWGGPISVVCNLSGFGLDGWLRQAQTGAPPYSTPPSLASLGFLLASRVQFSLTNPVARAPWFYLGPRPLSCRVRGLD